MKVIKLLDQISLREIEAAETIKNNALFDMQMVITELGFLEFALISLAISKVAVSYTHLTLPTKRIV